MYVIVNPETYRLASQKTYTTAGGAKRSLGATIKSLSARKAEYVERFGADGFDNNTGSRLAEWQACVVISSEDFEANEPMVERVNLMSGKPYMEKLNTPISCSPASETYWSM